MNSGTPIAASALAAFVTLALGASAGEARAQETTPVTAEAPGTKNGNTAFAYSLFGTALPCVASSIYVSREGEASEAAAGLPILAAYLAGPSLGHFYAGRPKRALLGIGVRSAAALGFAVGLGIEEEKHYDAPSANTLMLASVIVGLSSVLIDVFEAPRSARLHNEESSQTRINLAPAVVGPAHAPGLRADLSF